MSSLPFQLEKDVTRSVPEEVGLTRDLGRRRPPTLVGPAANREATDTHRLGAPQRVALRAFAVSKGPTLDHADGWECRNGPDCLNRTRVGGLHGSVEEARLAAPQFALRVAQLTMSREADDFGRDVLDFIDRLEPIHIVCVSGMLDACYDYRDDGCQIPDAYEQLCRGEGTGEAWDTVRRHREQFGAQAALLPGASQEGHMFAFTSACRRLSMTSVETISVESTSL